jgi:hypothetical protein
MAGWVKAFVATIILFSLLGCRAEPDNREHAGGLVNVETDMSTVGGIDYAYITSIQSAKHTLPFTKYLFSHVSEIPEFTNSSYQALVQPDNPIQTLLHHSFQLLNTSAGGFGSPLRNTGDNIRIANEAALQNTMERYGFRLNHPASVEWQKLPFRLRAEVVELAVTMVQAHLVFKQFAEPVVGHLQKNNCISHAEIREELITPWRTRELRDFATIDMLEEVDLRKLSFATRLVSEKLHAMMSRKDSIPLGFAGCTMETALGDVLISSPSNDTIKKEYALVVEPGGDDTYMGNTASSISIDKPFGFVVDMSGNDTYIGQDEALVAGVLGIAILLDLQGDDHYESNLPGLAFSLYGTSLLYDCSGDDSYVAHAEHTQAAAYVGSAVLMDCKGDDTYFSQSYSQAFGGTLGVGILVDSEGADLYNTETFTQPGVNDNLHFVQGTSKGRWAEATDGHSLAGGVAMFIDDAGNDAYWGGSFSQGASYFFGLGMFVDNKGADIYNAVSHSQGYAAHFSLAGFFEHQGDDTYNVLSDTSSITQILGGGRDLSAAWFVDDSGDDVYHFGNRSAGIGDMGGIGIMWDKHGTDKYVHHKNTINKNSPSMGQVVGRQLNDSKLYRPASLQGKGLFVDKTDAPD